MKNDCDDLRVLAPHLFHDNERYLTFEEICKLNKVRAWADVENPVRGKCWRCGYKGLVLEPQIGIY